MLIHDTSGQNPVKPGESKTLFELYATKKAVCPFYRVKDGTEMDVAVGKERIENFARTANTAEPTTPQDLDDVAVGCCSIKTAAGYCTDQSYPMLAGGVKLTHHIWWPGDGSTIRPTYYYYSTWRIWIRKNWNWVLRMKGKSHSFAPRGQHILLILIKFNTNYQSLLTTKLHSIANGISLKKKKQTRFR